MKTILILIIGLNICSFVYSDEQNIYQALQEQKAQDEYQYTANTMVQTQNDTEAINHEAAEAAGGGE